jgi:hypothetical protein
VRGFTGLAQALGGEPPDSGHLYTLGLPVLVGRWCGFGGGGLFFWLFLFGRGLRYFGSRLFSVGLDIVFCDAPAGPGALDPGYIYTPLPRLLTVGEAGMISADFPPFSFSLLRLFLRLFFSALFTGSTFF